MAEERFNFRQDSTVKFPTKPRTGATTGEKVGTALALLQGLLSIGKNKRGRTRQTLIDIQQIGQQRRAREQATFRNEMADAFREAALKTQKANTQFNRQLNTLQERRQAMTAANNAIQARADAKAEADQLVITNKRAERLLKIKEDTEKRLSAATTPETAKAIDDAKAWKKYQELRIKAGGTIEDFPVWKKKFWDKPFGLSETPDLNRINTLSKKKVDENGKEVTSPSLEFAHEISDDELLGLRNSDNPREKALGDSLFVLLQTEQQNKQRAAERDFRQ